MEDPATAVPSSLWASLNSWFTSTVFFVLLNLMIATIVFTSNLPDNKHQNIQQEQQQEQDQKKTIHDNRNQQQIARSPSLLYRLKSFNLYPQKSQQDESSETHYHQHPLEVAATQYVFDQPDYQHFDPSFTNPGQIHHHTQAVDTEHVTPGYDFDQIRHETGRDTDIDTGFGFDPTRQETRGDSGFGFDTTRNEGRRNNAFDFDPTRQDESNRNETGSVFDTYDEEEEHEFESLDEVYSKLKTGGHDRTKSDGSIRQKPPAKMKKSASLKVGFTHPEEEEMVEARRPATVREKRTAVKVVADDDVEVDSRADDFINKFKNDLKLQRIESMMRTKGATNRGGGN
ncbi:hypothetical protein Hdeb2414_s0018g00527441 [Helianthus debilis subsp. tardiflorus]